MDGDTLLTIGDLARRTGLTVKAIRFYSDRGLVPPTARSPAGYRLYGVEALARLEFVRTLPELGIDLPTVRRLVERDVPVAQVAQEYAEALDVRIRILRLRRAVLRTVAVRGSTLEETELMHRLAKPGRRRPARLDARPPGGGRRAARGAVHAAARHDQRLAGAAESRAAVRLVRPGSARGAVRPSSARAEP
ncbi:MerR family transcriptional regulator [Microtetraspora sp. NBRC 13810]|uniref:MerR family transcriptional regulator n=1 Tax=Microtetraspora sp. NBRC 13810 TaxID=3030990 RepID=UPI002555F10A|nr:MerR family transcriptional regulator [Microtetraspora sp. NBRC 13810]